jgi:hypothetical protein
MEEREELADERKRDEKGRNRGKYNGIEGEREKKDR